MFFSLYDFWQVSDFSWYCVQSQQVYSNTSGLRLAGGERCQAPVRAKAISTVCVPVEELLLLLDRDKDLLQ